MEGLLRLKQLYKAVQSAIDKIIGSAITQLTALASRDPATRRCSMYAPYFEFFVNARRFFRGTSFSWYRAAVARTVTSDISPRYVTPKRARAGGPCIPLRLRGPRGRRPATRSSRDTRPPRHSRRSPSASRDAAAGGGRLGGPGAGVVDRRGNGYATTL